MAKLYLKVEIDQNLIIWNQINPPNNGLPSKPEEEIANEVLRYLPKNTTLESIVADSPTHYKQPYLVTYDAPFFKVDGEIEVIYRRNFVESDPGDSITSIHSWDMLTEIKYDFAKSLAIGNQNVDMFGNPIKTHDDDVQASMYGGSLLDNKIEEPKKCDHDFIEYHGLIEKFKYCRHCDERET